MPVKAGAGDEPLIILGSAYFSTEDFGGSQRSWVSRVALQPLLKQWLFDGFPYRPKEVDSHGRIGVVSGELSGPFQRRLRFSASPLPELSVGSLRARGVTGPHTQREKEPSHPAGGGQSSTWRVQV
jgi:hypothetical protein